MVHDKTPDFLQKLINWKYHSKFFYNLFFLDILRARMA